MKDILTEHYNQMNRRHFLSRMSLGLGSMALGSLLGCSSNAGSGPAIDPMSGVLDKLHFAPKAKRVIYLFQSGGPSQMDLFDYKPMLEKMHGEELPASVRMGQRLTGMTAGQSSFPLASSLFKFNQYGESGAWVSDLMPYTAEIADEAIDRCFLHVQKIEEQLASPEPHIYRQEHTPVVFSLIRLDHPPADEAASFETVDRAVGVYVRARLGADRFAASYDPLRQLLENALARTGRSVSGMRSELSSESRADKYERWGHLLMAVAHEVPQGVEAWVTHDLYEPGTEIAIPLDPELKAIENAERYYEKARRTRQAREHAARRLQELEDLLSELQAAREELGDVSDLKEIREFRERHKRLLARSSGGGAATDGETGFRRYTVHGGYEVWVGRNARQNDELTFQHAAKHDVWMHARGVAGSHAVLRLPGRDMNLPRRTLQEAAGIAAYHSKAAGSDLVPVMHTARKYVRKPKNAPPGAVIVEREEMIIVPPELPHSR